MPRSRARSRISSSAPLPPRSRSTSATPSESKSLNARRTRFGRVLDAGEGIRDVGEQILAAAQVAALVAHQGRSEKGPDCIADGIGGRDQTDSLHRHAFGAGSDAEESALQAVPQDQDGDAQEERRQRQKAWRSSNSTDAPGLSFWHGPGQIGA